MKIQIINKMCVSAGKKYEPWNIEDNELWWYPIPRYSVVHGNLSEKSVRFRNTKEREVRRES